MLNNMFRRNLRQPLMGLAVVLFAAVLTVVLCYLHKSGGEERRSFEESYAAVPVFFKVVNLDGSRPSDNEGIDGLALDLFQRDLLPNNLLPFIAQTHARISLEGKHYSALPTGDLNEDRLNESRGKAQITVGISSTRVAEELTEGWGGKIYWYEGYDESILLTNALVCIVPESMKEKEIVELEYVYEYWPTGIPGDFGTSIMMEFREEFRVVGYYTDPGNNRFYCPYETMAAIHAKLKKPQRIQQIGAVLKDNDLLPQLRECVDFWFAEPNPMGEKTPWGKYGFEYYLFAMDIDDSMLLSLEANMQNSLRLNRLAAAVVFTLSAGAGFLTGFLVIRSRKREINLMRTLGSSNLAVCLEFGLEQLLLVLAGILVGGSYSLWEPAKQLAIFGGIYTAGLIIALVIFIKANLLITLKEDA